MVATKKKAGKPRKVVAENATSEAVSAVIEEKEVSAENAPTVAKNATTETIDKTELVELRKLKADYDKKTVEALIKKTDYEYFADFDKGSSIPAWSLKTNTEMLENTVSRLDVAIKSNEVPLEELAYAKEEYRMKKERLDQIKNSKPKLSGRQVDELRKKRDVLANEISNAQFTRLQMEKGLVDAHEEADRMSITPCVNVDREEFRRMGIPVNANGKVTRSVAEKGWKLMNGLLGDGMNPNVEQLRKDTGHSKRSMVVMPDPDDPSLPINQKSTLVNIKYATAE